MIRVKQEKEPKIYSKKLSIEYVSFFLQVYTKGNERTLDAEGNIESQIQQISAQDPSPFKGMSKKSYLVQFWYYTDNDFLSYPYEIYIIQNTGLL